MKPNRPRSRFQWLYGATPRALLTRVTLPSTRWPVRAPVRAQLPFLWEVLRRLSLLLLVFLAVSPVLAAMPPDRADSQTTGTVTLFANQPIYTMGEGIGVNIHSMITTPNLQYGAVAGSTYGAVPLSSDTARWNVILNALTWQGFKWIRLNEEMCDYEPTQGNFTFNSPNFLVLMKVLTWAQANNVDVLLQESWQNVPWNSLPTAPNPAQSAPNNMAAWAGGYATMVHYLVSTNHFTCIKMLNISNEPMQWWSWWQGGPDIATGYSAARTALNDVDVYLPLVGPEHSQNNDFNAYWEDCRPYLGAYESHDYSGEPYPTRPTAVEPRYPVYWGEYGNGWGSTWYEANIYQAKWRTLGMSTGIDGMARWDFLNQNNIDGSWSYIKTWDTTHNALVPASQIIPNPYTYYVDGLMSRIMPRNEIVHPVQSTNPEVYPCFLESPKGNYTIVAVKTNFPTMANHNPTDNNVNAAVTFTLQGLNHNITLHKYFVDRADCDRAAPTVRTATTFRLTPTSNTFTDVLRQNSITAYSTFNLADSSPGIQTDGPPTALATPYPLSKEKTVVDDSDGAIAYSSHWSTKTNDGADHRGTDHYTSVLGAYFQFTFTGTRFKLYSNQDNGSGCGSAYIDGTFAGYTNGYSPVSRSQKMTFDSGVLARATHTVTVINQGVMTSTTTSNYINFDAVSVTGTMTPNTGAAPTATRYNLVCETSCLPLGNTGSIGAGTVMTQRSVAQNTSQQWQLLPLLPRGSGLYTIVCCTGGMALDNAGSVTAGTTITQGTPVAHNANQQWQVLPLGGGLYRIVCQKSGMALDNAGSTRSGSSIVQAAVAASDDPNQHWVLVPVTAHVGTPAVPTGLTATARNAHVALSWGASGGAVSYTVYRATTAGGEGAMPIKTGITATAYTDRNVTRGIRCYYKVAAVRGHDTSRPSTEASAIPLGAPFRRGRPRHK
jgi:hypothetical protein